ncbi:nucleoid-associated protein [Dyadobacter aurulentus]|uniref:nucleoid-associated protein n=1 Tax=Dyadobacter sp. UC 10 TaxID=2605428 RepID=UPI0011F1F4CA|nr:nucleoid-associated protein [Dyadobacter sp. UC 10]KAA0990905.1 nucleoid-associated protein [Dyadobacter sp. UC 10]
MNITYTSLHHVDHVSGAKKIEIGNQSSDLPIYVDRLISEITGSNNSRQFNFRSDTTEIRTALAHLLSGKYDEGADIVAKRLVKEEIEAQKAISHLDVEIQKGSLFQAVLGCEGKTVVISKADHNEFLDALDFKIHMGLPWKKRIFKAFLVHFDAKGEPIDLYVYDTNAKMSRYWWDKFLELEEKYTDASNTKTSMDMLDKKVFAKIKTEFPADHTVIRNSAIRYFRSKPEFEIDDFLENTLNNYTPIDETFLEQRLTRYKQEIRELPSKWKFDPRFSIEKSEVKKRAVHKIQLNTNIELVLQDFVSNLGDSIRAETDSEGTKWVKIKATDEAFAKFVPQKS